MRESEVESKYSGVESKQQAPVFGLPWPLAHGIMAPVPKLGLSWAGLYLATV